MCQNKKMKIIRNLELFCQKVNLVKKINQNSKQIVKFPKKAKNNNFKFNYSNYKIQLQKNQTS